MATDEDLKLADLLKYHMRDTEAAKGLLYRRMRCLANLETANVRLDKARAKNKDVAAVRWFFYDLRFFYSHNFSCLKL